MNAHDIKQIIVAQRLFFETEQTKDVNFRLKQLDTLSNGLLRYEQKLLDALKQDLNKSAFEAFLAEFGMILEEIRYVKRKLRSWVRPQRVPTPITLFGAKSRIYSEPYGVVLIISPWNYPMYLTFGPLIGAIAAGNCAIIKPSELVPTVSGVLSEMITDLFLKEYVTVIEGDAETSRTILEEKFDYIFFTGSTHIGRSVMKQAAKHLTPVTLELGGKSPCIVDETANLRLAAKRIAWGKCLNAGQTCIAPDYLLVHENIKEPLIAKLKANIAKLYTDDPLTNENWPHIVNDRHFDRIVRLIENENIVTGGKSDRASRAIEPTLLNDVSWDSPVMQEEIFGPVLPIITYTNLDEAIAKVKEKPKPLALYLFSENKTNQNKVLRSVSFGGGCINDTIYHIATPHLPFGGVGDSGIGAYHGRSSFDLFSHQKSILKQTNRFDLPVRYPTMKNGLSLLRLIFTRGKKVEQVQEKYDEKG